MELKQFCGFTVSVIGIMAILFTTFLYMDVLKHEDVHWRIFRQYNIESKIEWVMASRGTGFVIAQTVPTSPTNLTLEEWDAMRYLHGLNEIENPIDFTDITFKALALMLLCSIVMFPANVKILIDGQEYAEVEDDNRK